MTVPLTPAPGSPLVFPRDVHLRQKVFDPRSFEHDARANLFLLQYLVDRYTAPGDLILDPMGGTGSLFLGVGLAERRVVCGEIERWQLPILESNRRRGAAWAPDKALAYQGDAANLPLDCGSVQAIITSPPYHDTFSDWHISSNRLSRDKKHVGPHGSAYGDDRGGKRGLLRKNIGNLHIYEDYLRAMRDCFFEYRRVLSPHGTLCLIVKDKIKAGLRVPIVRDLTTLLRAAGFVIDTTLPRRTQLSQYRQIDRAAGRPVIEDEQVIVCRRDEERGMRDEGGKRRWSLVMVPEAAGPPSLVYQKAMARARQDGGTVLSFLPGKQPFVFEAAYCLVDRAPDPHAHSKFKERVAIAYRTVEHLVERGLRAGDHVTLHVAWRYGEYLQRRLTTLGCVVEAPTRGLNMGQKLSFYTKAKSAP